MIVRFSETSPRANGVGRSFRDLSRYLNTGSIGEMRPERVEWSYTNCGVKDVSQAWNVMAWTSGEQESIINSAKAAGLISKHCSAKHLEETPVWHAVLSWEGKDNPTRERMMEAVHSFLKFHELEGHQFAVWKHADTDTPHLHIMLNLVHPVTGLSAKRHLTRVEGKAKFGLHMRSSDWACNVWEKNHPDETAAPERAKNWEKRKDNQKAMKAAKSLNKALEAAGGEPLPLPKLQKVYDKSPRRNLWQMIKSLFGMGATNEEVEAFKAEHRQTWKNYNAAKKTREAFNVAAAPYNIETMQQKAEKILKGLTKNEAVFSRTALAKAVNEATTTRYEFTALMQRLEGGPDIIALPHTDGKMLTTAEMARVESEIVDMADTMAQSRVHGLAETGDKRLLQATAAQAIWTGPNGKGIEASAEQKTALEHLMQPQQVAILRGVAGAGKSTLFAEAKKVWEADGYTVRGATRDAIAAKGFTESSGITASTIASLLWNLDAGRITLTPKTVLIVDEFGLLDSRTGHALMAHCVAAGAKLVGSGDNAQIQAINAGAAMPIIMDRASYANLKTNYRQAVDWQKKATYALADMVDKPEGFKAAIREYAKRGHITGHATNDAAIAAMANHWLADMETRQDSQTMMVAPRKIEVSALNAAAREGLRRTGKLGAENISTIDAVYERQDKEPEHFKLDLAIGEKLMFTKNDKQMAVDNGTTGTLLAKQGNTLTVEVGTKEKRIVQVDLGQYQHLAYAYAITITKSQGITVPRALVLASKAQNMDAHNTYVALSRHKDDVRMFFGGDHFSSVESLVDHVSRQRFKKTTLDYFGFGPRRAQAERAALAASIRTSVRQRIHEGRTAFAKGRDAFKSAARTRTGRNRDNGRSLGL